MVLSLYTQPHYSNLGWPPVTIRQVSTEQERVTVIPNMFLEVNRQRKISNINFSHFAERLNHICILKAFPSCPCVT